jgi:hypothetical protein
VVCRSKLSWLLFRDGSQPLKWPSFFQALLSPYLLGLPLRSLIGGVAGGVVEQSSIGGALLLGSSVSSGSEWMASDKLLAVLRAASGEWTGAKLVGLSLPEKRWRGRAVVRAEGTDLRLLSGGGE